MPASKKIISFLHFLGNNCVVGLAKGNGNLLLLIYYFFVLHNPYYQEMLEIFVQLNVM